MKKTSKQWDKWLVHFEEKLKSLGYRKFIQHYKNEDFTYWKSFEDEEKKIYQVGVLFYDHRKYQEQFNIPMNISIQYECMILGGDRIDLSVSKEMEIEEFEVMSKLFYESIKKYC